MTANLNLPNRRIRIRMSGAVGVGGKAIFPSPIPIQLGLASIRGCCGASVAAERSQLILEEPGDKIGSSRNVLHLTVSYEPIGSFVVV